MRTTTIPEKFDAIVPVSQKDFTKLPLVVEHLFKNAPVGTVYIVSPTPVYEEEAKLVSGYNAVFLDDQDVLPIDPNIFQPRTNWVYQQWIKLQILRGITNTDWFIVLDADLFVLRPLPFVANGKPGMFYARDKDKTIKGYGKFTYQMLGIDWNKFSLMNDIALYNKDVIKSMIRHVGGHEAFISRAAEICSPSCYPAEAQLYYAWVQQEYPDLYDVRTVTNELGGMYWGYEFNATEIKKALEKARENGVDTLSLHSWSSMVDSKPESGIYMM